MFYALQTQWDIVAAPDGEMVRTGLKYDRVEVLLRNTNGFPRRKWPALMTDLRAMEMAALGVLSKVRSARRELRAAKLKAEQMKR